MNISTISVLSLMVSIISITISIATIASIRRDKKLMRDMREKFADDSLHNAKMNLDIIRTIGTIFDMDSED